MCALLAAGMGGTVAAQSIDPSGLLATAVPGEQQAEPARLILDVEFRSLWYMTFFATGSARLGPLGRKSIRMMAPDARTAVEIVVTGRTDATGSPARNLILARERARSVARALRKQGAVKAKYTLNTKISAELFDVPLEAKTPWMPTSTAGMFRRADTELRQPKP